MLDVMTGGRVVAGMLRGTPNEYVTYDTNPAESRERFEEALKLIVRAWTEPQPFGWQGRYYEYRAISIWPRPVQQPHPPIYMSASSPEAGEWAARNRISSGSPSRRCRSRSKAARHYREQAARPAGSRRRTTCCTASPPRRRDRRAGDGGPERSRAPSSMPRLSNTNRALAARRRELRLPRARRRDPAEPRVGGATR